MDYARKPSYTVAQNTLNCLRRAFLLCRSTSPVSPTQPLSLGMSCPSLSESESEHTHTELRVSFQGGRKRQTLPMCHGLVLALLAQAGLCPRCQEAAQGDTLLWKRGQGQRQKMQKTAENVTPGYQDCNPPHNTIMLQLKEKWFKAATGSAMGISWSSDNI